MGQNASNQGGRPGGEQDKVGNQQLIIQNKKQSRKLYISNFKIFLITG